MTDHLDDQDSDEWVSDDRRLKVMEWAGARLQCAYIWGAKGEELPASAWLDVGLEPPPCREVFDCSGFAVGAMMAAKLVSSSWLHSHNADRIFHTLSPVGFDGVAPADLAFWGRPAHVTGPARATHVMLLNGDGTVLGASGGNQSTTTLEIAHKAGACVRVRSSHQYRPDFLGFRKLPLPPLDAPRTA